MVAKMVRGSGKGLRFPDVSYQSPVCSKKNEAKILKEFLNNGYNMTQAVSVVFPHYKRNSCGQLACTIYKKYREEIDKIKEANDELEDAMLEKQVLSLQKRRKWLSDVIQDDEVDMSDRINSMKVLNKIDGIGTQSSVTNITNNTVNLSLDERKKTVANEMKKMIEKDHDVIEAEYEENGE